jgi:hypothetical protein
MKMPLLGLTAREKSGSLIAAVRATRASPEQEKMRVFKPTLRESGAICAGRTAEYQMEYGDQVAAFLGQYLPSRCGGICGTAGRAEAVKIIGDVTVQSFDIRALEAMHRQAPEIPLAYLIENMDSVEKNRKSSLLYHIVLT